MSTSDKMCKGCSSFEGTCNPCDLPPIINENRCPCLDCLVKGVCTETNRTCSDYNQYYIFVQEETNYEF